MMKFANPEFLYLLLLVPVLLIYIYRKRGKPYVRVSDSRFFSGLKPTLRVRLRWLPVLLKAVAIVCFVFALARPRSSSVSTETTTEGIDVIITLDVSTSMLAEDFKPNRFRAAANVAKEFIKGRKNDRIGFVVFAGESYTQCPLTTDYAVLLDLIDKIKMNQIEDGTAIGTALVNSVNRLRESTAKSKVVILLTDGENNKGEVEPETAADVAQAMGVRIYTIGVGKKIAPYPIKTFYGRTILQDQEFKIDEEMLSSIADMTGGKYFKATNKNKLKGIYQEIDKLEKTKIMTRSYKNYKELYLTYLLIGLAAQLLALVLENSLFKRNI